MTRKRVTGVSWSGKERGCSQSAIAGKRRQLRRQQNRNDSKEDRQEGVQRSGPQKQVKEPCRSSSRGQIACDNGPTGVKLVEPVGSHARLAHSSSPPREATAHAWAVFVLRRGPEWGTVRDAKLDRVQPLPTQSHGTNQKSPDTSLILRLDQVMSVGDLD
jgi:hypothetical protein